MANCEYKKEKTKKAEAIRTFQEVGEIMGYSPQHLQQLEKLAIQKLVVGMMDRGVDPKTSILYVMEFLGVQNPDTVLNKLSPNIYNLVKQKIAEDLE